MLCNLFFERNKVLFFINLFFILTFWFILTKIYMLYFYSYFSIENFSIFSTFLVSFFDNYDQESGFLLYSGKDPKEYEELLKLLYEFMKNKFNNSNYPPKLWIWDDESQKDEKIDEKNFFVESDYPNPKFRIIKPDYSDYNIMNKYFNRDKEEISLDQLKKLIDNHNSQLKFLCKDKYYNKFLNYLVHDFFENEFKLYESNLTWNHGFKDTLDAAYESSTGESTYYFINIIDLFYETSLMYYNENLGAYFWHNKNQDLIPEICKNLYIYKFQKMLNHSFNQLDLNCDNLEDSSMDYIYNYADLRELNKELGDNLLCTGIQALFLHEISDFSKDQLSKNPWLSTKKLVDICKNFTDELINKGGIFHKFIEEYKNNHKLFSYKTLTIYQLRDDLKDTTLSNFFHSMPDLELEFAKIIPLPPVNDLEVIELNAWNFNTTLISTEQIMDLERAKNVPLPNPTISEWEFYDRELEEKSKILKALNKNIYKP
jgi:hypothetical protein